MIALQIIGGSVFMQMMVFRVHYLPLHADNTLNSKLLYRLFPVLRWVHPPLIGFKTDRLFRVVPPQVIIDHVAA